MCAPAIVNLYTQTKVDLFFNKEETLSYGRQTLANFQKFSMSIELITKVPLGSLLLHYELTDNTWSTLHIHRINCLYTSLGFARNKDTRFRDKYVFSERIL